ncbi:MAG TPA: pyruvate kinase [Anaerolineales bacterium]|nr:pyruvate kinase [Anaerolineales bacterium]
MRRRTKIVATLGPATRDKATIRRLIEAGMDVARLNFSHGSHADHAENILAVREQAESLGRAVTIMQDLQGPKIRTGPLKDGPVELVAGRPLVLCISDQPGTAERVSVDNDDLPGLVRPGSRILLSDGNLELVVKSCTETEIHTVVVLGGKLRAHQGINLPDTRLELNGFTEKDREDLAFGLAQGVDAVAMSFIRTAKDIARVRSEIAKLQQVNPRTPVIAKLERREALENLEEIIEASDGVMVARGDLGLELAPEDVPIAQKRIIASANRQSKLVITATQMLESMLENPRPTRAEASDVANAIFDGTDAVMLSGETAVGKYPLNAVRIMDAVVRRAEEHLPEWGHWRGQNGAEAPHSDAVYLTRAAAALAQDRHVAGIAVFTKSGSTALLMSKARPSVPILGFTSDETTYRRMAFYWGVIPHLVPWAETMEHLLSHVETGLLAETPVQRGQQVVLICGFPVDQTRPSNLVMLHTVGQQS